MARIGQWLAAAPWEEHDKTNLRERVEAHELRLRAHQRHLEAIDRKLDEQENHPRDT